MIFLSLVYGYHSSNNPLECRVRKVTLLEEAGPSDYQLAFSTSVIVVTTYIPMQLYFWHSFPLVLPHKNKRGREENSGKMGI
jgi:hypothetical protein